MSPGRAAILAVVLLAVGLAAWYVRDTQRALAGVRRNQQELVTQQRELVTQQRAAVVQQRADDESTCRILALGRRKPGEPPPGTALGQARAQQYEDEYRARGCP